MTILVTGGCGFIGSNFIIDWFENCDEELLNIDILSYASNKKNLDIIKHKNYKFFQYDVSDKKNIKKILDFFKPRTIVNFAAETHVDKSIRNPFLFFKNNILKNFEFLNVVRNYYESLTNKENFKFINISTDEVYGSLSKTDQSFTEHSKYYPNSPYSASKASFDHIVRSYNTTFGLPVITTYCSNNYGPFQFNEKLIPLTIDRALKLKHIPIYGNGKQIRDWLYVKDHCKALRLIIDKDIMCTTLNIGGGNERQNIKVVKTICKILDQIQPRLDNKSYTDQIKHVNDRLGHDTRYSINYSKISNILNWKPETSFEKGLEETIEWYLENNKF